MNHLSQKFGIESGCDPNAWRLIQNDLEVVAARLCPDVRTMKGVLRQLGARGVGMSGSGPTVFGIFPTAMEADAAADKILNSTDFLAVSTHTLAA